VTTTLGFPCRTRTRAFRPGIRIVPQVLQMKCFSELGILTLVRIEIFRASSTYRFDSFGSRSSMFRA